MGYLINLPSDTDNGLKLLCEGTAGGPQGSAITSAAFPVLIGSSLKGAEAKSTGVEARGIQDNTDLFGDPALVLGVNGALMLLPAGFEKADLKPSKPKFQAFTTTLDAYLDAPPPD